MRLGFITPTLLMGGAERYTADLIRRLSADWEIAGLALYHNRYVPEIVKLVPDHIPITAGCDAVKNIEKSCDCLIVWGLNTIVPRCQHVVYVSHGYHNPPIQILNYADLVAVSKPAGTVYGGRDFEVLFTGVQPERIASELTKEAAKAKYGIPRSAKVVGFLGRWSPEKNPAAAALACKLAGHPYVPLYLSKLAPPVVDYLGRFGIPIVNVDTQDVAAPLRACDCLLAASDTEGCSLAIIEAWLAGVPVAATQVGAVPELEESFGRLVYPVPLPLTAASLVEAITKACEDSDNLSAHARTVAERHLTMDASAARWHAYLQTLASQT